MIHQYQTLATHKIVVQVWPICLILAEQRASNARAIVGVRLWAVVGRGGVGAPGYKARSGSIVGPRSRGAAAGTVEAFDALPDGVAGAPSQTCDILTSSYMYIQ